MCDDTKWTNKSAPSTGQTGQQTKGGKRSGIKDLKTCPQLERTVWCQKMPLGHHEEACHEASQTRRKVLRKMKQLVDAHVDSPVCPEWDTSETCENTPGPYRFGVEKPSRGSDTTSHLIIASQLSKGCECIKRNGLQDECKLPRCRGSPACRITPFPRCEPFLGIPTTSSAGGYQAHTPAGQACKCPQVAAPIVPRGLPHSSPKETQTGPLDLSEGECLCVCR